MSSSALYKVVTELMSAKYEVVQPLGNGVFGTVYLVKDSRGTEMAMKKIQWHRERAGYDSAIRESKAFALTRHHAHVVECIDGYADENYAYIVMEYCDGGNLNKYMLARQFNYQENLQIMLQLADAVSFLHHNEILHRDLRPHNILIKKAAKRSGPS
ncbi:serine/threonine-protein kinase pdik1l-like [Saccoglossus kowalevskii]|uniref:Serine/threonine-protein kinase PDIK1L-like n=1 Tax=Saccoglossus kowalevskii TaxID=10224 RepID=A0ABM0GP14_SACKO|nr:PREDICTED: serine/threonine-protein kinase PDIK1L-like [Saccoglossus kowalevskii]